MTLPFAIAAEELRELSRGSGLEMAVLRRVDSTNRLGRRILDELARDEIELGTTMIGAWEQTAGRGRLGRDWHSAAGAGVWASLLLAIEEPSRLARLPLACGVGLAEAVERLCGRRCTLKWPNDLLVNGRKIGGILVDVVPASPSRVVIGYGVNLSTGRDEPVAQATSLAAEATGDVPSWGAAAWSLLDGLHRELQRRGDADDLLDRYRDRSVHRAGDRILCRLADRRIEGTFVGFTTEGFLRLEVDGREEVVTAGEVFA